jgi:hypothetical protein
MIEIKLPLDVVAILLLKQEINHCLKLVSEINSSDCQNLGEYLIVPNLIHDWVP